MSQLHSRATEATTVHRQVLELNQQINRSFLQLGAALHRVYHEKHFATLDYASFSAYLSAPEVSLSISTGYALMGIYEKFVMHYHLQEQKLLPIGRRKLEMVLPLVTDANVEELLSKAEALSTSDLQIELQQQAGRPAFEYKYSKHARLSFKGETELEKVLQHRSSLLEWQCITKPCSRTFYTIAGKGQADRCPFCNTRQPTLNGTVVVVPKA